MFGAGEYRPGTDAGQRLLSHELMHVVQQSVTLGNSMKLQRKATPDDEKKKTEAVKKHEEQQRNVAKLLQEERGLATTTLKDPLDPHNVYRNTVELLDNNKIRLILLTPTHYSTKGKPVYFDTRVAHDRVGGDYPTDPATTSGPGLVHPVPGESGATLKITQPPPLQTLPPKVEGAGPGKSTAPPKSAPPPAWSPADVLLYLPSSLVTKDELRDLLIHEGQHVADWSHLRPATLGDSKTILEEYKTEFRAHWLQPGATIMSDEPLRSPENPVVLPPGRQCVACPAPAPGPGGSPAPPRTMETHLKNKKQAEIFRKLINEYTDDQFDCFYVCDKAFRDQVDAFDRPEGENLVNSARLVNLHIELQKLTPEMKSAEINKTGFLNAAESLDEIDWAFLTKESSHKSKRLSEPFWKLLENFAPKVIYQALRTVQKKADVHKALQEAMAKLK